MREVNRLNFAGPSFSGRISGDFSGPAHSDPAKTAKNPDILGALPNNADVRSCVKRNFQDEKDRIQYGAQKKRVLDTFPDFFINSLSRTAYYIRKEKVDGYTLFLDLYHRYAEELLEYIGGYFAHPVYGLDNRNTGFVLDIARIGLAMYAYWVNACPKWEVPGMEKKMIMPDSFMEEAGTALRRLAGKYANIHSDDYKENAESDPSFVPDPTPALIEDDTNGVRLSVGTTRTAVMGSLMLSIGGMLGQTDAVREQGLKNAKEIFADFIVLIGVQESIGRRGQKDSVRIARGQRLYPKMTKIKGLEESFGPFSELGRFYGGLALCAPAQKLNYWEYLAATFGSFGLTMDYTDMAKKDREQILLTMEATTYESNNDAAGEDEENVETGQFYDKGLASVGCKGEFELEGDIVFGFTAYALCRKLEMQAKEKVSIILKTELRERHYKDLPETEKASLEKLKNSEKLLNAEREKNKSLRRENQNLAKRMSDMSGENTRLKNKNAGLASRLEKLEARIRALETGTGSIDPETESSSEAGRADPAKDDGSACVEITGCAEEAGAEAKREEKEEVDRYIRKCLRENKVIMFGGDQNLVNKLDALYPDMRFISADRITSFDTAVKNAGLVLFKHDSLRHTIYKNAKGSARNAGVAYDYLPPLNSPEKLGEGLYSLFKKYFG